MFEGQLVRAQMRMSIPGMNWGVFNVIPSKV